MQGKNVSPFEEALEDCKNAFADFKYKLNIFNSFYAELNKGLFNFNINELDLDYINKLNEDDYEKRVENAINNYLNKDKKNKISEILEKNENDYNFLNLEKNPKDSNLRYILQKNPKKTLFTFSKGSDFNGIRNRICLAFLDSAFTVKIIKKISTNQRSSYIAKINKSIDNGYVNFYIIQRLLDKENGENKEKIAELTNEGLNSNDPEWDSKIDPKGLLRIVQKKMELNLFLPPSSN